jgi:tetratricopeptide (TPR) repeat protein
MEESQLHKAEEYIVKGMKILHELKIEPYSARGYLYLGELYPNAGQWEKALETLKRQRRCSKKWEWITTWPGQESSWKHCEYDKTIQFSSVPLTFPLP